MTVDILQVFSALTLGQEIELVWRQPWSLMTIMYLGARYIGLIFWAAPAVLNSVQTIPLTDTVSSLIYVVRSSGSALALAMLCVIIVTRLYAMYQRSRRILIFLVVTFLAVYIFTGVVIVLAAVYSSGEELIIFGNHQCSYGFAKDITLLVSIDWIVSLVWEVLALCLAIWIAVKHFRELRLGNARGIIKDSFTMLIKTQVIYLASFVAASCLFVILDLFPTLLTNPLEDQIFYGLLDIFMVVQRSVLGPRLILSIREYHAKLVVDSNAATDMISVAFQERVYISTSSSV
ncbi:uncharacterized protein HD556DRAFT_1070580 [Suillus plorans]|uniref:DUF6533 domain-containing protein n=1 Tax=Suillus plorans TaxID=116603 RepID=A0A9P7DBH9_9AGAM|nr:uncharacterized protein HD556DRAFT_1070580 [Suillus plorans]KAG1786097.1 hypothetical protein HD556DRAFT_1070580 [Suillus plorans]